MKKRRLAMILTVALSASLVMGGTAFAGETKEEEKTEEKAEEDVEKLEEEEDEGEYSADMFNETDGQSEAMWRI